MTNPKPLQVRRRGGAKRPDHGTYVAPAAAPAASVPLDAIGSDVPEPARPARRRASTSSSEARRAANAAYAAKPKVIVRGVVEDVYFKLRAIYKHQLHGPDGIEGWSEFGRQLLRDYVQQYESEHGEMTRGEDVQLPPGRRVGT